MPNVNILKGKFRLFFVCLFCNGHNDESTKIGHNFNPFPRLRHIKTTGPDNENNNKSIFTEFRIAHSCGLLIAKAR